MQFDKKIVQIFTTIDFHFAIFAKEISCNGSRTQAVAKRKKKRQPNQELSVSRINTSEANHQPKEMLPSNEVANAQRKKKRQPNQELSFLLELMGRFELLASSLVCHKWQKEQVRALPAELSAEQRSCERHRAQAKVYQQIQTKNTTEQVCGVMELMGRFELLASSLPKFAPQVPKDF